MKVTEELHPFFHVVTSKPVTISAASPPTPGATPPPEALAPGAASPPASPGVPAPTAP